MKLIAILLIAIALILLFKKDKVVEFPSIRVTRNGVHAYFYRNSDVNTFGLIPDDVVGFPKNYCWFNDIQVIGQGTEDKPIIVEST